jgi:hypothetical protein
VVEVVGSQRDAESGSGLAADMRMAEEHGHGAAPPVLVNNVETMANVALIVARGAQWFREIGTPDSPGTILCTFTSAVQRPGVIEVAMGTTLRAAIEQAGGVSPGRTIAAVMVGVSSAVVTADQLDTPLSYGSMSAIGSGLGSAGFVVLGDDIEPVAVAAGVAHFLAIESCGQCARCKEDGADIARLLAKVVAGKAEQLDLDTVAIRLGTVADGARCSLAAQQPTIGPASADETTTLDVRPPLVESCQRAMWGDRPRPARSASAVDSRLPWLSVGRCPVSRPARSVSPE